MTRLYEVLYIFSQGWPVVILCHSLGRLGDAWMVEVVKEVDYEVPLGLGEEGPWHGVGDFTEEIDSGNVDIRHLYISWLEAEAVLSHIRAALLSLCYGGEGQVFQGNLLEGGQSGLWRNVFDQRRIRN